MDATLALQKYRQALDITVALKQRASQILIHSATGALLLRLERFEESIQTFRVSWTLAPPPLAQRDRDLSLTRCRCRCRITAAVAPCPPPLQTALVVAEAMGDLEAQAELLHNVGGVYEAMGNLPSAKKPLRKAYRLLRAPAAKGLVDEALAAKVSESLRRVKRVMRVRAEIETAKKRLEDATKDG